jgi:hypothetical protein
VEGAGDAFSVAAWVSHDEVVAEAEFDGRACNIEGTAIVIYSVYGYGGSWGAS